MANSDASRRAAFEEVWREPPGFLGWLRTINNIPIAHRYMVTAFAFFLAGGVLALLMRVQLGRPENTFLDAATYNQLFTMHGTTMMFLFVIPFIEALAAYVLPLLLGTRDLPFPRLTALSYWTYLFGGLFLYSSFLFGLAPDGGWFAYVPLSGPAFSPGLNLDFWDIGLSVAEVAALGAAAELIAGILRMRAPGMTLNRLPVFAWAMLVTAAMIVFAFTPLIVGTALLELDRKHWTRFFDPDAGGKPLLWQHLFWVFGHPEVYIMFLPAVGIVSHIIQVFARRPLVGYTLVVLALVATGFLSFGLWVHHMFTTGLSPVAMSFFTAATMMIAIPTGLQVFVWIVTLWRGRPLWRTPLFFAVGFIAIFVLGGLSGVMLGAVPFNWQVHDTHFVVAHLHYVLIGGVVFPLFAGLYYWLPKITGRRLSERVGRWNAVIMFVTFNVAFFPMHVAGLLGMPRRIYTYAPGLGWDGTNLVATVGAFGFAAGVLLFLANVAWSLRFGEPAGNDPWGADTLEWAETSPPPEAQFPELPVVESRHPLWEQTTLRPRDASLAATLAPLASAPSGWRGVLVVSVLEARPVAIAHLPGPTFAPLILSVGLVFLFVAALVDSLASAVIGSAISGVALVGWFRPQPSERIALDEIGVAPPDGRLPLAIVGPVSSGWWATLVFVLVLATALASLVASHFYLLDASTPPPAPGGLFSALLASAALLGVGGTMRWLVRGLATSSVGTRRVTLGVAWLLVLVFLGAAGHAVLETRMRPWTSAHASSVVTLLGFEGLVGAVLFVMLGVGLLWAWRAPDDPRGHAAAANTSLVSDFAVASWLVVLAILYGVPRLW